MKDYHHYKETMANKGEKHSGQQNRELFIVFSHPKQATFSFTRTITKCFQRLLNKLRDMLRMLDKPQYLDFLCSIEWH